VARAPAGHARRALSGLTAALALGLAACGGGDEPANDVDAVAKMLREAAGAAAKSDGDGACDHLSYRAQTQIVLQTGGRLGNTDCPGAVGRALLFMSPAERARLGRLVPSDIRLAGDSGSAVMRSPAGDGASPIIAPLSLAREDGDWKIAGFGENTQAPGF
jgi:hypothetical protein